MQKQLKQQKTINALKNIRNIIKSVETEIDIYKRGSRVDEQYLLNLKVEESLILKKDKKIINSWSDKYNERKNNINLFRLNRCKKCGRKSKFELCKNCKKEFEELISTFLFK